jgi:L-idonate 5-dehydrogenase
MPGQPGAFAEFLRRPVESLVRIPPSVSDAEAAALEPLAIGVHAVRLLGRSPVRRAAVIGCGPVGLCALAALRALKGSRIVAGDVEPARLRAACRMGAVGTVRVSRARPMRDQAARFGAPPVVVEAGGTAASLDLAIHAAAPGGTVLVIGIMDGFAVPVDLHAARRKELTLINVRRSNGELPLALRLVASGRVDLRPMLTHQGGFADAQRLFRLVDRRGDGAIKAVLVP